MRDEVEEPRTDEQGMPAYPWEWAQGWMSAQTGGGAGSTTIGMLCRPVRR